MLIFSQKTSIIPTAISLNNGTLRGKQTVAIKNMSSFPKYNRFEDPSSGIALTWPNPYQFSKKSVSAISERSMFLNEITDYQQLSMNKNQDLIQDALRECEISENFPEDNKASYC